MVECVLRILKQSKVKLSFIKLVYVCSKWSLVCSHKTVTQEAKYKSEVLPKKQKRKVLFSANVAWDSVKDT